MDSTPGTDDVVAALGQSNRVCKVILWGLGDWQLEKVLAPMRVPYVPFPELRLHSDGETWPVIPYSFLGGSAPRLRTFSLDGILFPELPNLLLSANHLVYLRLFNISHYGHYISPEGIVALLSVLSSLRTLSLGFKYPHSHLRWESRSLSPPKRSILPALNDFRFRGVSDYLEDVVTRIDTPQLKRLYIDFLNQNDFDTPRLTQFINSTATPRARDEAHVQFNDCAASFHIRSQTSIPGVDDLQINIPCIDPDRQLSSMIEHVCNTSLHPLSTVEDLYIHHRYFLQFWENDAIESTLWLQLLLPFTAVKNLYLSKEFAPGIAAALQDFGGGGIMGVLLNLQNIFVKGLEPSGPFQENIAHFVAARQLLSDHPIVIAAWD
jgi:hypothetical protein